MEKTAGEALKEKLFKTKTNGWDEASEEEKSEIFKFSNEYIYFLNKSKTEREAVETTKGILIKNDFKDIEEMEELNPGDKVYYVNRDKSIYMAVIGNKPIEDGLNIIGSHIDSPRLDLKPNPLYEDTDFAMLKTH